MNRLDAARGVRLGLLSPEAIRAGSAGEVTRAETLRGLDLVPVPGGLFAEEIFGARWVWRCACGGPARPAPAHGRQRCGACGATVTRNPARGERFGHVELAVACAHPWFARGAGSAPSDLAMLLDLPQARLDRVLAYAAPMIVAVDEPTRVRALADLTADLAAARAAGGGRGALATLIEVQARVREVRPGQAPDAAAVAELGRWPGLVSIDTGAPSVRAALAGLDLDALAAALAVALADAAAARDAHLVRRARLIDDLRRSGQRPEWMVLTALPVLPPDLRPLIERPDGRLFGCDVTDLYLAVVRANGRYRRLAARTASPVILGAAARVLQLAVDQMLAGGERGVPAAARRGRFLRSLGARLAGKGGRLRRDLLGKRVDYSARAVIVADPALPVGEVGLPRALALELLRPFVLRRLLRTGDAPTLRAARRLVERRAPAAWEALEALAGERLVLLNRAPTLHRLGLQAFRPRLVDGHAIRLPVLVCGAFNADFDGDQMAVHLPLSTAAQAEATERLWSVRNVLSAANGQPSLAPSQDAVLGCHYLTLPEAGARGEGKLFSDADEVELAYGTGHVALGARVTVRVTMADAVDQPLTVRRIETTVGRCLFNAALPPGLRWRPGLTDGTIDQGRLTALLRTAAAEGGPALVVEVAETVTRLGFTYATRGGLSLAVGDVPVPAAKGAVLAESEARVAAVERQHGRGLLTDDERSRQAVALWTEARERVADAVREGLDAHNPLAMMVLSGARGTVTQLSQMAGMRGLMADPTGRIIDVPIRSNFREGLTVLEYFISTHGARKGTADTALRTADAGYLTRRLVAAAQSVIVVEEDCGTTDGIWLRPARGTELPTPIADAGAAWASGLPGRVAAATIAHQETGAILAERGDAIDEATAQRIVEAGIAPVAVRSVLTCAVEGGVCQRCYGRDLATGALVQLGEAVGVVAAQSVGEPGTQLTLRTFHTGGVAGRDITAGLPRVEALFEARRPRGAAALAAVDGTVTIARTADGARIRVVGEDDDAGQVAAVPPAARLLVGDGDRVAAGTPLTDGALDPAELLAAVGATRTARFLVDEVQAVYRAQGVAIHDKHLEVIVRQMLRAVTVMEPGDTALLPGEVVGRETFVAAVDRALAQGGAPAIGAATLVGVGRAGALSAGFLAAAAGREPARTLARAALARATDELRDLTGNVLLGRRLPAGAGWGGAPVGSAWRLAPGNAEPLAGGDDRLVAAPREADEAEIDAQSLATLLAGLHAPLEPAPAG